MPERWAYAAQDDVAFEALNFSPDHARACVICLPAMGLEAQYYTPFAEALCARSIQTVLSDYRGQGSCSVQPSRSVDFGYREAVEFDLRALVRTVRRRSARGVPIVLLGHSLGGHFGALYSGAFSSVEDRVDALALVAAGTVYYRNWLGAKRYQILAATSFAGVLARTVGFFPGDKVRFGGVEGRTLITDWAHNGRTGIYAPKGSGIDYEAAMRTVDCPVLAVSLKGDTLAPERAVDHLVSKMPLARLTRRHLRAEDVAESRALDHFRWARHAQDVASEVDRWVEGWRQEVRSSADDSQNQSS